MWKRAPVWSIAVSLCAIAAAHEAVPPKAILAGPDAVPVGSTVFLEAGDSQGDAFQVFQVGGDPVYGRWFDSERCYVFGAPNPGTYQFALVAVGIVGGKAAIDIAQHAVRVADAPEPGPGPAPGPVPLPPGRFDLATQSRDWASLVLLSPAERQRTAQLLAGSFDTMAAKIAAGAITTIADAIAQTKAANQAALGQQASAWLSWADQWKAALTQLNATGKVKTLVDVVDAWRETATGLRAVP